MGDGIARDRPFERLEKTTQRGLNRQQLLYQQVDALASSGISNAAEIGRQLNVSRWAEVMRLIFPGGLRARTWNGWNIRSPSWTSDLSVGLR
jgi:hypothetical protein